MSSSSLGSFARDPWPRRVAVFLALWALVGAALCSHAFAVAKIVRLAATDEAIDLASAVEYFSGAGDKLQVAIAPGPDGIVRRIEVGALQAGVKPNWMVFALTNDTDEQLTRLLVVPHYRFVNSGVVWPDLGATRIVTITASQGDAPEREDVAEATPSSSPSIPARPSLMSRSCARRACRKSISGRPTPTRRTSRA